MMSGSLPESQTPLAPDDAGQFLDEMLLGRPQRLVLGPIGFLMYLCRESRQQ
jgi:hypothetical protein